MKKLLGLALLFMTFSTWAKTDLYVLTSYITRTQNVNTSVNERTDNPIDVKLNWFYNQRYTIGLTYHMGSYEFKSASSTTTHKRTAYGLNVGWNGSIAYLHATYYLSGEYDFDNGTIYKEGSGFQFDIGWKIEWGKLFIVPQVTYRSLSYKKSATTSAETELDSSTDGDIVPYIGLMYRF
jgi:hypothetical protein